MMPLFCTILLCDIPQNLDSKVSHETTSHRARIHLFLKLIIKKKWRKRESTHREMAKWGLKPLPNQYH